jgi:hypothetical protein
MPAKTIRPSRLPAPTADGFLQRHFWLVPAVLYLVVILGLFSSFIFSNDMLFGSDTIQAQVYMKDLHREYFRWGDWIRGDFKPKWSPYLFGGMPFVDAFHSDILNLPTYLFKFVLPDLTGMPLYRGLGWALLAHFWLAGMFMYLAAHRGWRFSRQAALLAGLAYMLAPYLISMVHPGHDGKIFVTAWFPLGFLNLKLLWDQARWRHVGYFGLVVGTIILTPHVQMAYFALWAYGSYSAYRIVLALIADRRFPWRPALGAVAAVALALGMSAWQFLPGFKYVKSYSPRAGEGRGFDYATSWSLHPEEMINSVNPEFSGVSSTSGNSYWGRNAFKDNSEYGGLVVLLLALYAVFATRVRDRWFFLGLGGVASLYALGAHTPLFTLFYHVVPNVKQMRAPSMIMFLYVFSICLLSAAAIDALGSKPREERPAHHRGRLLWYAAALLTLAAVVLSLSPSGVMSAYTSLVYSTISAGQQATLRSHLDTIVLGAWIAALLALAVAYLASAFEARKVVWAFWLLMALVAFDDLRMDRRFIDVVRYDYYFGYDPVVEFLRGEMAKGPIRVLSVPGGFPTNYFPLMRVPELLGYHGNQLRTFNRFLGGSDHPRAYVRRTLDLASVGYLVFRRGTNLESDPADPSLRKVYDRNGTVVFLNLTAAPWARLVTCWEQHDPKDSLYDRLWAGDFPYGPCVVTDSALPFPSSPDSLPVGSARIAKFDPEEVVIETESDRMALLVYAENVYPAWHAFVDGQSTSVITTNATFRGVVVPSGRHTVQFRYQSNDLDRGARLYFASILCMVGLVAWDYRKRRPPSP